jgi:hypothetical protein
MSNVVHSLASRNLREVVCLRDDLAWRLALCRLRLVPTV